MLALHGVTGHSRRWQALADALPEIRLLAIDLRGHGHSPWTPPGGIDHHLLLDGDRWHYRYSTPARVATPTTTTARLPAAPPAEERSAARRGARMARPAITPPPGLPTLLMPAAKEDYVDPAWVDRVRDELGPLLTVQEVDSAHMVYLERTAEVAAAIRAFLG